MKDKNSFNNKAKNYQALKSQ